ncbi:hypothetical protein AURANDRAFT_67284 [Aureococcus anophagefferens]|uniref:Uncharacterized protein n=1 Tax=Aureococcus anophagefferens TaxID=44056 RepID=F0YKN0_AURAN|nr:hypothetical protein AURANDRAFT_67284 [Aureococcus anophagefferens]EGB04261.1 hypothetical protein AURANDRAFT_67284 [Aureococcus anophagefferens]|eukprot:XP_009040971.1 hypothetical protein AURANDRAFT_67284 [Aureococcus anophagefferens]
MATIKHAFKGMSQKELFECLFHLTERLKDVEYKFQTNNKFCLALLRAGISIEHMAKRALVVNKADAGNGLRLEMLWEAEVNDYEASDADDVESVLSKIKPVAMKLASGLKRSRDAGMKSDLKKVIGDIETTTDKLKSATERVDKCQNTIKSVKKQIGKLKLFNMDDEDEFNQYQTQSNELNIKFAKATTQLKKSLTMRDNLAQKSKELAKDKLKLESKLNLNTPKSKKRKTDEPDDDAENFAVESPLKSADDSDAEDAEDAEVAEESESDSDSNE